MTNARDGIIDVLHRYSTGIDTTNWDLLRTVFSDDCIFESGPRRYEGLDDVMDFMQRVHAPLDATMHRLSNIVIQVDEQANRATVRTYGDALLVRRADLNGPTYRVSGFYDDVLCVQRGEWVIQHRVFSAVWREGNPTILGL